MSDAIKLNPALAKLDVLNVQEKASSGAPTAKVTSPVAERLDALADRVERVEVNAFADNLEAKLDIPDFRPDADLAAKPDVFVKEGPSFWKVIDGNQNQPNPIPGGIEPGGDDGLTPPTGVGPGPMPGPVSALDAFRHLFSK